jgi:glycerol transport system ATP-binding protein
MTAGLELRGVSKLLQRETYLADIQLCCEPGSFTVLLGRVRAGKTTLLRTMAGLDRPTSGQVVWNGNDVTHGDVRTRDVAMVYQQFVNYPSLTVYENIASPLRIGRKLARAALDARVRETARSLQIEELLQRRPAALSGGQQQRTAMARALAKGAKLVLLDEPLANLDYKLREQLRSQLRALFLGSDTTVVYATAEPSEALWLGGTTAVMDEGRLLQVGPAMQVYGAPNSEQVARVFSDPEINLFDVDVTGGVARAYLQPELSFPLHGSLTQLPAGRYRFGVRAHQVQVSARTPHDLRVPAQVTLEEISGSETLLRATSGGLTWTSQIHGVQRFSRGADVTLFIAPEQLLVFDAQGRAVAKAGGHGAD